MRSGETPEFAFVFALALTPMTNILTLRLDPDSQALFDHQRQTYYPAHLNQIAAHLTLFHTLPDSPEIAALLQHHSLRTPFPMQVTGLRSLGRGVAYKLASHELQILHTTLAAAFAEHLSPQDRQPFQPHIVVQNKSTPERAKSLLAELQRTFQPFEAQAVGLDLWHYLNGPWQHAQTYPFTACTPSQ